MGKLQGFLPYKLLDPSRLEGFHNADGSRSTPPGGYKQLVGTKLRVRVTQVRPAGRARQAWRGRARAHRSWLLP